MAKQKVISTSEILFSDQITYIFFFVSYLYIFFYIFIYLALEGQGRWESGFTA